MPSDIEPSEPLVVTHAGRRATIEKNQRHPEEYLFITVDERRFFLGVLERHMTRGDVRRMGERWLEERA